MITTVLGSCPGYRTIRCHMRSLMIAVVIRVGSAYNDAMYPGRQDQYRIKTEIKVKIKMDKPHIDRRLVAPRIYLYLCPYDTLSIEE